MIPSVLVAALVAWPLFAGAQTPGSIVPIGNTLVSAMMMFLGNDQKVYILDKAEGNPTLTPAGHPAWASVWDISTDSATVMEATTNPFCAAGMHLPNASYAVFGGNQPIMQGGLPISSGETVDPTYLDYDGRRAVRILNPQTCTGSSNGLGSGCQWYDDASNQAMQSERWYPAAEAVANGSVILIGGAMAGGYVNRNLPNTDPFNEGGGANPTYELYPSVGTPATVMQFMGQTSGLNMYAHTYLMASGKMFVQANLSTTLWDYDNNVETPLEDMPNAVVRVYPASGAVAMLPLTPSNNWTPTILFCGGSTMSGDQWGNYTAPNIDTWLYPASNDCQRITPESPSPVYVQDDDMLEGRTMGQFIILPTGQMVLLNGAGNGTAGYAYSTPVTPQALMPYGMSLASSPTFSAALYDPVASPGQRWSRAGFQASQIPRMYHSSAILLPDASILVAGSNPNIDYNPSAYFSTEYTAERLYPPYWGQPRPSVTGIPMTLSYGGAPFDLVISSLSYTGDPNAAAVSATAVLLRPGFTTHAMNMGQRFLQLNNTFLVDDSGNITLHVSQVPPNPNLLTPGPCLFFVTVNGVPSNGTMVIVGNGQIALQPTSSAIELPASVGTPSSDGGPSQAATLTNSSSLSLGVIIGAIAGAVAIFVIIGVVVVVYVRRRRPPSRTQAAFLAANHGALRKPSLSGSHSFRSAAAKSESRAAFIPMRNHRDDLLRPLPYTKKGSTNSSVTWEDSSFIHSRDRFDPNLLSPNPRSPYRDNPTSSTSSRPHPPHPHSEGGSQTIPNSDRSGQF